MSLSTMPPRRAAKPSHADTIWVGRDKVPVRVGDLTDARLRNLERYLRLKAEDQCARALADATNEAEAEEGWYAEVECSLFEGETGPELFLHPIHADLVIELKRRHLQPKEDGE